MARFVISDGKRYLRYFFPNNNFYGKPSDILGFSQDSYMTFPTEKEAHDYLRYMFKSFVEMEGEVKLYFKVWDKTERLKVNADPNFKKVKPKRKPSMRRMS